MAIRAKLDPQNHFIMGLEARENELKVKLGGLVQGGTIEV
jgi:hypothetical protein